MEPLLYQVAMVKRKMKERNKRARSPESVQTVEVAQRVGDHLTAKLKGRSGLLAR